MANFENFKIILNKQNPIYLTGESIKGKLKFKVSKRITVNSIGVLLSGDAKNYW